MGTNESLETGQETGGFQPRVILGGNEGGGPPSVLNEVGGDVPPNLGPEQKDSSKAEVVILKRIRDAVSHTKEQSILNYVLDSVIDRSGNVLENPGRLKPLVGAVLDLNGLRRPRVQ